MADDGKLKKKWFPLESNPSVMTSYVEKWGFPTDKYEFVDVLSTEEWALAMVPTPVQAVVMLYPIKDSSERLRKEQATRIAEEGQTLSSNVYYMKQYVGNACGTIGLLHAIGNSTVKSDIKSDSFLTRFFSKTRDKSPEEIASILEDDAEVEATHGSAAQQGQSSLQDIDEPINTHFVCFSHVDGGLYELDGRKDSAIYHGPSCQDTLLRDACTVISKEFMEKDPEEVRFTIIALAKK